MELLEEKDGIRPKALLKKYAEQKHIHGKYFRLMNGFISWRANFPENADQNLFMGYEMFYEAAFKLGRIRPSKAGKNFARACQEFSHPENRVYFPFADIEYQNIV